MGQKYLFSVAHLLPTYKVTEIYHLYWEDIQGTYHLSWEVIQTGYPGHLSVLSRTREDISRAIITYPGNIKISREDIQGTYQYHLSWEDQDI